METLIVLTTLMCGAIAAPALQEQGFQEFKHTQHIVDDLTPREKKSPVRNNGFGEFIEPGTLPGQTFDFDSFPESARSLNFKKPIIVKKKVGYHLYRDSDEEKEQTTSRESCNERVKVKLCDEKIIPKSIDSIRSTTIEDVGDHIMSEDEMKHSLKMAKEAIANLERDLNKIEQNPGTKTIQRKHDGLDAQIHQDIDTARQVLDHIHKNFGDLDSMSIQTTTSKDADSLHNVHFTIAKTEEEKMAQWKEAMKNIQKNAEIARNIEDSYKSAAHAMNTDHFPTTQTANLNENNDVHKEFDERRTKNTEFSENNSDKPKQCNSKLHDRKLTGKEAQDEGHSMDDMKAFASTLMESNLDENSEKLVRHDNHKMEFDQTVNTRNTFEALNENNNNRQQSRSSDSMSVDTNLFDTSSPKQRQTNSMRTMENKQDNNSNLDKSEKLTTDGNTLKTDTTPATSEMKSTELNSAKSAADCMNKNVEEKLDQDQTDTQNSEHAITSTKSASDVPSDTSTNLNVPIELRQRQSIGASNTVASKDLSHQSRIKENDAMTGETQHVEHVVLPLDNTETNNFEGKVGQTEKKSENSEFTSPQDQETFSMNLKPVQTDMKSAIKSTDNDNTPTQPTSHTFNMRWSSDQNKNTEHPSLVKEPNDFRSDLHNRAPSLNTHFMNGPQMTPTMTGATHFDASTTHSHMHSSHVNRLHGLRTQGKSPGMDNMAPTNFNGNMRDATGNFGHESQMHWKPSHESARAAYGSIGGGGSGASPSAVGLFPNANVGGCSIPLLLSCSPQVTSGSLAKALPAGYASPAYRTEDDFTFFPNKREIKKINEVVAPANKMPTNLKQKTKTISDTKK